MKQFILTLLLAIGLATPVFAQTMVAKTITFTGAPQSQQELLTLSALTPGATLTKDQIDAAANRLDASGLFTSVQYSTSGNVLTFELESSSKAEMQQVRYANFAWYTQAQLSDAVHAKLPLFTGSVPANGELKDQVAHTLAAILKERGIDAVVDSQGIVGGKLEYRIVTPPVLVTDLQIENIRWDSDPILASVRQAQVNIDYLDGLSQTGVHDNLAYALQELGFLDETVGSISHTEPKMDGKRITVVMTGAATTGSRYKVARVTLPVPAGTVTAKELGSGEQQVKAGGLPSPSLVKNTELRMAFVFQGHGFLDAKSSVDASKDSDAHTVSYTFSVAPGEVYHLRDVLFAPGMSAEQKSRLTAAWKLQRGAVYERDAIDRDLMTLPTLCAGRPATTTLTPDQGTHQVDVTLNCKLQR